MKKFMVIGVTLLFAFAFTGCGKSDKKKCEEEGKEWKDGQCVDREDSAEVFIITNKLTSTVKLEAGGLSLELDENDCAKVKRSDFDGLSIFSGFALCDSEDASKPCLPENYEVAINANNTSIELKKVNKPADDANCKVLFKEGSEHTITNLLNHEIVVKSGNRSATLSPALTINVGPPAGNGNGCVKVKEYQFAEMQIIKEAGLIGSDTVICDNQDDNDKCSSDVGHLALKTDSTGYNVVEAVVNEDCAKELK